jgi:hypothetical protein
MRDVATQVDWPPRRHPRPSTSSDKAGRSREGGGANRATVAHKPASTPQDDVGRGKLAEGDRQANNKRPKLEAIERV